MRVGSQALLSLLVVMVFAGAVFVAKDWEIEARAFPWIIGIPMLFLGLLQFALDLRGQNTQRPAEAEQAVLGPPQALAPELAWKRTVNIFGWIYGFLVLIWLLGFHVAVPLVVFGYLKLQSREGWFLSAGLTAVAWGVLWGVFDHFLHLPFPRGVAFQWIDWITSR